MRRLNERSKILYWSSRQDAFLHNLPQGFVVGNEGTLAVVFSAGTMKHFRAGKPIYPISAIPSSAPSQGHEGYLAYSVVKRTPKGELAILKPHVARAPSEQFREIIFFMLEGRELSRARLEWSGWYPSRRSFLCMQDGAIVCPHDPGLVHELGQPNGLFDRYDQGGRLVQSFGRVSAEDEMARTLLLANYADSGFWAVSQYPYMISRFNTQGDMLWERGVEMPSEFQSHPRGPEVSSIQDLKAWLAKQGLDISAIKELRDIQDSDFLTTPRIYASSFVKDVASGEEQLAVLTASDATDQNPRTGKRIDLFAPDGELQQSFLLDHPASFIQFAPDRSSLWVLHEAASKPEEFEREFPYLVEYTWD